MPLTAPNLDDRQFEDLLREARLRIPRYCPDWTDFNDSDPGMALVQLFAWFTDQMLWRLNQVPERAYINFLKLLNLELRPARPARSHVVFTASAKFMGTVTVPARCRFEVPGTAGADLVVFETVGALDLVPYALDMVQVLDGVDYQDYSKANERGNDRFRPFGWVPQRGNALYLGFKPDDGEVSDEDDTEILPSRFPSRVVLRIFRPPPSPTDRAPVSRGDASSRMTPQQKLVWEYQSRLDLVEHQAHETLDRWRPLTVIADETMAFTREGNIVLRSPGADLLASRVGKPAPDDKSRYWIRCRLADGLYTRENVPEIAFLRVNATEVEALATFAGEVLGESDGFQREFALRNTPVVADSLKLRVEGTGEDVTEWTRVDDFLGSSSTDTHFTLNPTSGVIQFGDGRNGQLPAPGGLIVARSYVAGGGTAGNVPANAINSPPAGVAGIDIVTNPRPAVGGQDEETLDRLKERAPRALRGDRRAVTLDDYLRFAEEVPGVAKANAIEQRHPDHPDLPVPGAVTVVVVPDGNPVGPDGTPLKPLPSQDLLDLVVSRLNPSRMIGSELFVSGPDYRDLKISVRVAPSDKVTDAQVKAGVAQAIVDYLAPTRRPALRSASAPTDLSTAGAANPNPPALATKKPAPTYPQGWPFGEPFYAMRIYEVVLAAIDERGNPLIRSVEHLQVWDGTSLLSADEMGKPIMFRKNELPFVTTVVELPPPADSSKEPRP